MNRKIIVIIGSWCFVFFVILFMALHFNSINNRYNEIEPKLDNYSDAEILLLSFERLKTALVQSNNNKLDDYLLKMTVFKSKIRILENKSMPKGSFYHDEELIKIKDELNKKTSHLQNMSIELENGNVSKLQAIDYMNEIESTLIDLQEVIYKIQIRNFNEVKKIIKDNTEKAEGLALLSLILILFIFGMTIKSYYFFRKIIKKKNLFISSIHHELAGSTQAIMMALDIIENELVDDKLKKKAKLIAYHANKLNEQTREVMDFSRLEMGSVKVNLSCFSVYSLVSDAVNEIKPRGKNNFKVFCSSVITAIHSDKYKVYRMLINLLDNANKYTENGTIVINVKVMNGRLFILVKDNGIGFNIRKLKTLYKAFNQGAEKETRQGLGLGLTIIKNYVDLLKGRMRVRSTEGVGTTFFLYIPVTLGKE